MKVAIEHLTVAEAREARKQAQRELAEAGELKEATRNTWYRLRSRPGVDPEELAEALAAYEAAVTRHKRAVADLVVCERAEREARARRRRGSTRGRGGDR